MERDVYQLTWNNCCHRVEQSSNIVRYTCCTNGTVSSSEFERVSYIMMLVVN
jgi:hypothetical protein